jgi:hypothetical protein
MLYGVMDRKSKTTHHSSTQGLGPPICRTQTNPYHNAKNNIFPNEPKVKMGKLEYASKK